jgi:uncharacterized membrane protein YdjX (TVP38/TMEM64 family)
VKVDRAPKPKRLIYTVTMMKHGPTSSVALRCLLVVAVVALVVLIVHLRGHHFHVWKLRELIERQGAYGPALFFVIYLAAVVLALPESPFTALAGTLFHPGFAIVQVSLVSTIGAAASFLAARYWARDFVSKRLAGNAQFKQLDELVEQHGSLVTLLIRIVPLFPSALLNYGFGLTKVGLGTFVISTWVGMLPGIALYVMGTDLIAKAYTKGHLPGPHVALLLVVIGLLAFLSHKAWHYIHPASEPASKPA